jgi:hypothetical protein
MRAASRDPQPPLPAFEAYTSSIVDILFKEVACSLAGAIMGATPLSGCGGTTSSPRTSSEGSAGVNQALQQAASPCEHSEHTGKLWACATGIAASGDETARRLVSSRLLTLAREIRSPSWRDKERELVRESNATARVKATPVQLEEQLALFQNQELDKLVDAMGAVGGPDVTAYCFSLAEDENAPEEQRWSALLALDKIVDPGDLAALSRRLAAMTSWGVAHKASPMTLDTPAVVESIRFALRWRCYRPALEDDPRLPASMRLVVKLDSTGAVSGVSAEGAVALGFSHCLEHEFRLSARFAPPPPDGSTLVVPIDFTPDR